MVTMNKRGCRSHFYSFRGPLERQGLKVVTATIPIF